MYDGIFFINSALKVNALSIYSEEERYDQMLKTLDSIDAKCPNNLKIIFDSSYEPPKKLIGRHKTVFLTMGLAEDVSKISSIGSYKSRSIAECISFIRTLEWLKNQPFPSTCKRIYKVSGRYLLNDNFVLDDPSYKDAFVFVKPEHTWMNDYEIEKTGVDKLYKLRCWHMDYFLLDTFHKELYQILDDCIQLNIDVEHSYYKNLSKYKTIEVDKIGICGNIAPSGEYIDE